MAKPQSQYGPGLGKSQYGSIGNVSQGSAGPAPTSKPPTPPQNRFQSGTLNRSKEYRTPPVVAPPQVPSNYAPNYPRGSRGQQYGTLPHHPQVGMVQPQPHDGGSTMPRLSSNSMRSTVSANSGASSTPPMSHDHYGTYGLSRKASTSSGDTVEHGQYGLVRQTSQASSMGGVYGTGRGATPPSGPGMSRPAQRPPSPPQADPGYSRQHSEGMYGTRNQPDPNLYRSRGQPDIDSAMYGSRSPSVYIRSPTSESPSVPIMHPGVFKPMICEQPPPAQEKPPPAPDKGPSASEKAPPAPVQPSRGRSPSPPGQSQPAPGQSPSPPGQRQPPPVKSQPPLGQSQPPPGQSQPPPGQPPDTVPNQGVQGMSCNILWCASLIIMMTMIRQGMSTDCHYRSLVPLLPYPQLTMILVMLKMCLVHMGLKTRPPAPWPPDGMTDWTPDYHVYKHTEKRGSGRPRKLRHRCETCGKLFVSEKKLLKHEEACSLNKPDFWYACPHEDCSFTHKKKVNLNYSHNSKSQSHSKS